MNKANVDWVSPLKCLEVYGSDALHTRVRQKSAHISVKVQSMQLQHAACAGGSQQYKLFRNQQETKV